MKYICSPTILYPHFMKYMRQYICTMYVFLYVVLTYNISKINNKKQYSLKISSMNNIIWSTKYIKCSTKLVYKSGL